ncbi:MAG TPA: S8 family serine peptidase [Kineosporiaceae bacterium]
MTAVALVTSAAMAALCTGLAPSAIAASSGGTELAGAADFVVVAKDTGSLAAARAAVQAAGGTVTGEDVELGLLTVSTATADFAVRAGASAAVYGVAANRKVGAAPKEDPSARDLASLSGRPGSLPKPVPSAEPLAPLQWDMAAIGATPSGSYARQQGSHAVLVGIMDTGVDGTHPDIAPNFNRALSRNFVTDLPDIDGPCEHPSCVDPVDEDDDGHGTHVAGTIGSPINGIGIAGVAPKVSLVNIRAGQDSGYFFLEPMIRALRYAGDVGIDVVNMSFYVDPWLYNCTTNPADPPAARAEQRAIIMATQRALDFAHRRNVTLVSALGNEHTDLGHPGVDATSPDYPANAAYSRTIDNSTCLNLPAEGRHVIGVSAIGKSGKKADYSNYGLEQNDVSAPGGYFRDFVGTAGYRQVSNLILAPMPRNVAVNHAPAVIDPTTGQSTDPSVIASCAAPGPDHCTYWQYLQGTSMASPHAAGVAALIVAQYGHRDRSGLTMDPDAVEAILKRTATHVACPAAVITYGAEGRDASYDAACSGSAARNSIYGDGVVNAARAVGVRP